MKQRLNVFFRSLVAEGLLIYEVVRTGDFLWFSILTVFSLILLLDVIMLFLNDDRNEP